MIQIIIIINSIIIISSEFVIYNKFYSILLVCPPVIIDSMSQLTPLSTATNRRDLFPSPRTTPKTVNDEVALSSLSITATKLKDLEAEIAKEAAELGDLKDAIRKSEQISTRLEKLLGAYEQRMGDLERVVMPVYRNILTLSQVNDRIETTIDMVDNLIKTNDQVRKELVILLPGPQLDNLLIYLDSMSRLGAILGDLNGSGLGHCRISLERAATALQDARQKVDQAFRDWLAKEPDSSTAEALQIIVDYALNSSNDHFSALVVDWIEVRSNLLAASLESFFSQAQTYEKDGSTNNNTNNNTNTSNNNNTNNNNSYYCNGQNDSCHPLPIAYSQARELLSKEESFIAQVWPTTAVGPTFLRSAQIVRDLALSTVEVITGKMKKALARREYADQVYLFSVLGASVCAALASHAFSTDNAADLSLADQVLLPSLKYFATCTATILTDLIGEVRGTIPRALERPFTVAQSCTVYELTSITVNVLKRIESEDRVLEAILRGQSTQNWDGSLITEPSSASSSSSNHLKRFYTDILGHLESLIDSKSKSLRRPMQTLLFQLNNYNYLVKGLAQIKPELIDPGVLKRYDQIIEALKRSFFSR